MLMTAQKQTFLEKRAFPRYPAGENSAVLLTPSNILSYKVLDVSKSGMAFCYSCSVEVNESNVQNKANLIIYDEHIGFFDVSILIISDSEMEKSDMWHQSGESQFTMPYLRRCGVEFKFLNPDDKEKLENYVECIELMDV